jgi:hypothetical protein
MATGISISEDILKKTDNCKKDFACLSSNKESTCNVESVLNEGMKIVKCKDTSCSYSSSYGYSNICNCPTRNEIYNKYNL